MKFLVVTLTLVALTSAEIVTRSLPFLKTLAKPSNYVDVENPYIYHGVSRCEFANETVPDINVFRVLAGSRWECLSFSSSRYNHCTVRPEVRDLTSVEFVKVSAALCAKYTGFLMIEQSPYTVKDGLRLDSFNH